MNSLYSGSKIPAMRPKLVLAFLTFLTTATVYAQQKGYYRTPALSKNTVVFTAEGDLWKYDLTSGITARLTTHEGMESDPLISPDGQQLIFTGEYEGVRELYAMSIDGGVPKRLTYDFSAVLPACWAPDGKLLYRTNRYNTLPAAQLVRLDLSTGNGEPLPLAEAAEGSYNKDGVLF